MHGTSRGTREFRAARRTEQIPFDVEGTMDQTGAGGGALRTVDLQ